MIINFIKKVSLHPASWVSLAIAGAVVVLGYFGIVDKNGPLEDAANTVISEKTGIPKAEIQYLEGVGSGK